MTKIFILNVSIYSFSSRSLWGRFILITRCSFKRREWILSGRWQWITRKDLGARGQRERNEGLTCHLIFPRFTAVYRLEVNKRLKQPESSVPECQDFYDILGRKRRHGENRAWIPRQHNTILLFSIVSETAKCFYNKKRKEINQAALVLLEIFMIPGFAEGWLAVSRGVGEILMLEGAQLFIL